MRHEASHPHLRGKNILHSNRRLAVMAAIASLGIASQLGNNVAPASAAGTNEAAITTPHIDRDKQQSKTNFIHIENDANVPAEQIEAFKIAVKKQSKKIDKFWGTGHVEFTNKPNKGWPLKLESITSDSTLSGNAVGYHGVQLNKKLGRNQPFMVAAVGVNGIAWQKIADHEAAETEVNRWCNKILGGLVAEVGDGDRLVKTYMMVSLPNKEAVKVPMADVNTPTAFTGGPPPYDLAGAVTIPLNQPGGWQWGYGTSAANGKLLGQFNKRGTTTNTYAVRAAADSNTAGEQTIISYYPN